MNILKALIINSDLNKMKTRDDQHLNRVRVAKSKIK